MLRFPFTLFVYQKKKFSSTLFIRVFFLLGLTLSWELGMVLMMSL